MAAELTKGNVYEHFDGERVVREDYDFAHKAAVRYVEEQGLSMTVEDAERMKIPLRGHNHPVPLSFIAKYLPAKLDSLIDRTEPGTNLFYALTLVCEKYEHQIAAAVSSRNSGIWGRARKTMGKKSLTRVPLLCYA